MSALTSSSAKKENGSTAEFNAPNRHHHPLGGGRSGGGEHYRIAHIRLPEVEDEDKDGTASQRPKCRLMQNTPLKRAWVADTICTKYENCRRMAAAAD
jgi:hypothetical protein